MKISRVRRSRYLQLRLRDRRDVDPVALLRGEIEPVVSVGWSVVSPVGDVELDLGEPEVDLLRRLPAEAWTETLELTSRGVERATITRLATHGVLISDAEELAHLLRREEEMEESGWGEGAAFFHRVSQWRHRASSSDGDAGQPGANEIIEVESSRRQASENAARFIEAHGPPPEIVPRGFDGTPKSPLPASPDPGGDLFSALSRRRTCRTFASRSLDLEKLATLLRWTFGCHGLIRLGEDYEVQHKTSPSGGAMHPVEAYPLVLDVEGLDAGFYHYGSMNHRLSPVRGLDEDAARRLAVRMAANQDFFGDAGVVVVLAARFHRSFWKYPEMDRAYAVILQDLGHLSQTFYLLATHLGLGAAYTGAVASDLIAETLRLDPMTEGPLGLCACGHRREDTETWLPIHPFDPDG